MTRRIPIFQMAVIKSTSDIPSLIFSSELENYQSQSFQFCLPIHKSILRIDELISNLNQYDISMPFSYKNESINLNAKLNFPYIEFNLLKIIGINKSIKFEIVLANYITNRGRTNLFRNISRRSPRMMKFKIIFSKSTFLKLNYIGNWKGINKNNTQFILLNPLSLKGLEEIYLNYNLIPIGTTLNFGLRDLKNNEVNINFNRDFEK